MLKNFLTIDIDTSQIIALKYSIKEITPSKIHWHGYKKRTGPKNGKKLARL